jgi:hypothetical protein
MSTSCAVVRDLCTHSSPERVRGSHRICALAAQMMVRLEQLGGKLQMQTSRLDRATL